MWFQAAECNAANANLLLNLNNYFLIFFFNRVFPFWIPTYPKNPKICDPILETLLKMRPHYGQSSRENATPSSGTSLLASCKIVSPYCGSVRRDAHEIFFRMGIVILNLIRTEIVTQKGIANIELGSASWVQTKRTLVSTVCDKWCNEC